jgi:hypothetical protein
MIDEKKSEMLDQLAAQAMNGLLAKYGTRADNDYLAKTAYEMASSMMAHRARVHAEARRMVADQQKNAEQLAAFEARQRVREPFSPFATLNS